MKKLILPLLIGILIPTYVFSQLNHHGLVAYYPFDSNAVNAIGNILNDGVVKGGIPDNGRMNDSLGAYFLNNSSSGGSNKKYLAIPPLKYCGGDSVKLFSSDFTIVFWCKSMENTTTKMFVFSVDQTQISKNLNIILNDNAAFKVYWDSYGIPKSITGGTVGEITDGLWHQLALRRSGSSIDFIVDGTLKSTTTSSFSISNQDSMVVGFNRSQGVNDYSTQGWKGYIDDLHLYNRALADGELIEAPYEPQRVVYLPFDGNANDQSGNGNHGKVVNATLIPDRFGNANNAYHFDSNAYIKLAPLFLDNDTTKAANVFSGDFTISFWQRSDTRRRSYVFSVDPICGVGASQNLNIEFNDVTAFWTYWNSGGNNALRSGGIDQYTDGKWHNIVLRRAINPHVIEMFIDGDIIVADSQFVARTIGSNLEDIYFGLNKLLEPYGFYWIGDIDDVEIYNKLLTNEKIKLRAKDYLVTSLHFSSGTIDESIFHSRVTLGNITGDDSLDTPYPTTDRFGQCDYAYHFNGKGYIKLEAFSKNPLLNNIDVFGESFTIAFWERSEVNDHPMFAISIDTLLDENLNVQFNNNEACKVYWNSNGLTGISSGALNSYTDSLWHLVVIERDKLQNKISLYIDNVLKGSITETDSLIGSPGTDIIIGQNLAPAGTSGDSLSDYGWQGDIDDILIYRRLLSSNEMQKLYEDRDIDTIMIDFPKQGDQWAVGSFHNITWTADFGGSVEIEFSTDSVRWTSLIGTSVLCVKGELNKYLWQIPEMEGPLFIRVRKTLGECIVNYRKILVIPSQQLNDYKWDYVTLNGPFKARDGAGALVYNNAMWLIGGWTEKVDTINADGSVAFRGGCSNEVWKSVNEGANWTKERAFTSVDLSGTNIWEQRHTAGYVIHNNEMWILGGDPIQGHYQNDVWSSKDGINWDRIISVVPWGDRVLHYTLEYNNKIWVMGGQKLPGIVSDPTEGYYNDVWNTTDGVSWQQVAVKSPWEERGAICGNLVFNDRMWVVGGGTYDTPERNYRSMYNDVWSTQDGINWNKHVDYAPWDPREYHNVAVFDNKMWVIGGFAGANRNDVWYSSDGVNWYELLDSPWPTRHASSVFVTDRGLWLVTGNNLTSDVWKLCKSGGECVDRINWNAVHENVLIYPNPTNSLVTVSLRTGTIAQLSVKDVTGRPIMKIPGQRSNIEMDLSLLNPGIYIVEITEQMGGVIWKKIIKE